MKKKNKFRLSEPVRMVTVLFLICALTAAVVSGVSALTRERIDENLEAKLKGSFAAMFGEDARYSEIKDIAPGDGAVYEVSAGGETYYCVNISSAGFESDIVILVSFESSGRIAGVSIVSQRETPGIGSRIEDEGFLSLFAGKRDPGEVDSLVGATVSSRALKAGIAAARSILEGAGLIAAGEGD